MSASALADRFVTLAGARLWARRVAEIAAACAGTGRTAQATRRRFEAEAAIQRLRAGHPPGQNAGLPPLLGELLDAHADLPRPGRARMQETLRAALTGEGTLVGLLHLARTARLHRARGLAVAYAGWRDEACFDLLACGGVEAEISCDVVSAEDGRHLHRGAWVRLVDRIDPDLQTWLAAHPGRYLLKMTLPEGLRVETGHDRLAALHARVRALLQGSRRAEHDEACVLRLDPLMLAGAQADELGLFANLRRAFGHEAHLAVTGGNGSVFVMAARAGREDEVAAAVRRRLSALAPTRLTGTRPGILAMLVEDTDRAEWTHLRDRLILEGEARRFLASPEARRLVGVTCETRLDLLAAAPAPELSFRNSFHPASRTPGLALSA